jgi:multiple sugar transport system substrate-binding protein
MPIPKRKSPPDGSAAGGIFRFFFAASFLAAAAVSCRPVAGFPSTAAVTRTKEPTPRPSDTAAPTAEADLAGLMIWLPPAFRSDSHSPGGNLLQDRVDAFAERYPDFEITIRIKAASGAGGLRDSLAAAAAAAPGSLPDLVALDQSNLHAAAIKSLIRPLDGYVPASVWDSLYPYALSLADVGDSHYGLPFAGDALVLAGTEIPYSDPFRWSDTADWTGPLFLPLGDSRALFPFFGYYAAGGRQIQSLTGAVIDTAPLESELTWLSALQERGVLGARSLQLDSFESSFQAAANYGDSAVTLFSIVSRSKDTYITYLPTPEGRRFSLATGWAWAIASQDPARAARAAELMLWLADPQFLSEWAREQGVLPPSRTALQLWKPDITSELADGLSAEAASFPIDEVSAYVGPILAKAVRRVLLDGTDPATAARETAQAIHP